MNEAKYNHMKIKFWYVRHGETLFNRKGRLQGTCDSPLSQTGILEAEETAAALKNVYFDRIFVSPAGRARATAAYIAEGRGIEPEVIDDLHEMDFGRLEGSRFASHPDEVRHCFDIRDFSSANGETLFEVEHRIDHAMRTIRQSCKDGDRVLIVSHGMLESLFMVHLFNFDFRKFDDERHAEGRSGMPASEYADGLFQVGEVKDSAVYRLYNTQSGEHLYTMDANERNVLTIRHDWSYEGISWNDAGSATGGAPVYRVYNPASGEHHYTTDANERAVLVSVQHWKDEGVAWYSDPDRTVPVYRLYHRGYGVGGHMYTKDAHERDVLKASGWNDEGIGWYTA